MAHDNQRKRAAKLRWVALGKMRVTPLAQRKFRKAWADTLAATFDPEELGNLTLHDNGDGTFNIIDGQHRHHAARQWFGEGWEAQQLQCWVYSELSDAQQAEKFLKLNDVRAVAAFDKFKVAITAGRPVETAINNILHANGLVLARGRQEGGVGAVGALRRVFERSDGIVLDRALKLIGDAYGDAAFDSKVIDGMGHLCQRYNGVLKHDAAVEALSKARGGVSGLLAKAEVLHKQTGNTKALCVAAAAVEIINRRRGGKKLPSWWKSWDQEDDAK